jgi:hypothetical protein
MLAYRSDPYVEAIQQPNVSVHFTWVDRLTEDSVVGTDGIERKIDSVICASGEFVSFTPYLSIRFQCVVVGLLLLTNMISRL